VPDIHGSHLRHAPVCLALKSYQPWSRRKEVPSCMSKIYVLVLRVLDFTGQRTGSWGSWMMSQSQYIK
jgi:hypothetical protein